jgi:hypothetical protein
MGARMPAMSALEATLRDARASAFAAPDHGTWALYERLKGSLQARCPDLGWREYEQATRQLARIAGV